MNSRVALITFMDNGGGGQIDNTLPGSPAYPSHGPLPPGAVTLPVFPFDPTIPNQGLPGSQPSPDQGLPGSPTYPSQGLPGGGHISTQPIVPGGHFVVKWFACHGLILVPDNTLPATPEPK